MGEKGDKKKSKRSSEASSSALPHKTARKSSAVSGEEASSVPNKGKAKESSHLGSSSANAKQDSARLKAPDKSSAYQVGAVLVTAADFAPPQDIYYTLHHQPGSTSSSEGRSSASLEEGLVLSGETDTMDIVGWNWDLNASVGNNDNVRRDAKGYSGEYLVGVYDPDQRTVTLRAAPMFTLRRSIKSLNSLSVDSAYSLGDWQKRVAARRGLGEAFGNRKTKAKARAEDRMKVDTSNMLDVMSTLQDEIEDTKQDMVSLEQMNAEAEQARPIPPPDLKALTPHEAYPPEVLIPDAVFRLLSTKNLEEVESQAQLAKLLPARAAQSAWLKERMWSMIQSAQLRRYNAKSSTGKAKVEHDEDGEPIADDGPANGILKTSRQDARTKLKLALYVALLWSFLAVVGKGRGRGGEKAEMLGKLKLDSLPGGEAILADLFSRFSEVQRGAKRGTMTNFTETKLYSYMFALCLHLDDFSIDPAPLARDLAMPPVKVNEIFRSLGCTSSNKSIAGPDGSSRMQRRTVLKCPIELPKPRKGRKA